MSCSYSQAAVSYGCYSLDDDELKEATRVSVISVYRPLTKTSGRRGYNLTTSYAAS